MRVKYEFHQKINNKTIDLSNFCNCLTVYKVLNNLPNWLFYNWKCWQFWCNLPYHFLFNLLVDLQNWKMSNLPLKIYKLLKYFLNLCAPEIEISQNNNNAIAGRQTALVDIKHAAFDRKCYKQIFGILKAIT